MTRRPRLDLDGFHHIVNRGVSRNNIYRCDEDKEKFLEILCKSCNTYKSKESGDANAIFYLFHDTICIKE